MLAACGRNSVAASVGGLFAALANTPHREVMLNENTGHLGRLSFSTTLREAKNEVPSTYYWSSTAPGSDLAWCTHPLPGRACDDIAVQVFAGCPALKKLLPCTPTYSGKLNEIEVSAVSVTAMRTKRNVVTTLRGISIGSPVAAVNKRYEITQRGQGNCTGDLGIPSYDDVTVTEHNTLIFGIYDRKVMGMQLLQGRFPHYCTTGPA